MLIKIQHLLATVITHDLAASRLPLGVAQRELAHAPVLIKIQHLLATVQAHGFAASRVPFGAHMTHVDVQAHYWW